MISKIIPREPAKEGYSGLRQQHTIGTGAFCKEARCALRGLTGV